MPTPKTKKYKVVRNPELVQALKGFVPVFGNALDLNIVDRVFALEKKLALVDNEVLRKGDPKKMTEKMKSILFEEGQLVHAVTSRNLDF
jgi:hypothetical protein